MTVPARPVEADSSLVSSLFMLAREMKSAIDHEVSPHGITAQQAALVLITQHAEGCGVSHLAGALGTDAAAITRLVDRLEVKGFIVRADSPTDRRAVIVKVTPDGDQLTPELQAAFQRAHDRLLECLQPGELEQLRGLIGKMRDSLAGYGQREAGA